MEPQILIDQWPTVLALLTGLITFKATIITLLGPYFGLSKSESVRTGLLLSGGGEFAFVVLTLADKLHVLPDILAKLLVGVVVISMAMTPYLAMAADKIAGYIDAYERKGAAELVMLSDRSQTNSNFNSIRNNTTEESSNSKIITFEDDEESSLADMIIIVGFGPAGQLVSRSLSQAGSFMQREGKLRKLNSIAFDLDPDIVTKAYKSGERILYGDGSQPKVLVTAGIENPLAFVVTHAEPDLARESVERLRIAYPSVPIISRYVREWWFLLCLLCHFINMLCHHIVYAYELRWKGRSHLLCFIDMPEYDLL